jgi:hypothetical protein
MVLYACSTLRKVGNIIVIVQKGFTTKVTCELIDIGALGLSAVVGWLDT